MTDFGTQPKTGVCSSLSLEGHMHDLLVKYRDSRVLRVARSPRGGLAGLLATALVLLSSASAQEIDLSGAQASVTALVGVAAIVMGIIVTWGLVKRASSKA